MAIAAYVGFCLLLVWSALRYRSKGWRTGVGLV
jgi:hypothetical protein